MAEISKLMDAWGRYCRAEEWWKAYQCLEGAYKRNRLVVRKQQLLFRDTLNGYLKSGSARINSDKCREAYKALRASYFLSARDYFDDYCIAVEWERQPQDRFYLPRRMQLLQLVNALQDLADDKLDILCISLPPGVGKTGLAVFFLCWLAGRDPLHGILGSSHNTSFLHDVYAEILREISPDGDYRWSEIFSERKVVRTNALDMKIDVDQEQRFSTFQFGAVGQGLAGKVRAIQLLYCDDLVPSQEVAMSRPLLDKLYGQYTVDLRQRKQGRCKELHIATRWSLYDVIGRIERSYANNPRVRIINRPALDEYGNSNFDYGGKIGFTKEFYENLKAEMDEVAWNALYMGRPMEREGVLYPAEMVRRYLTLPKTEPDTIQAVVDTSSGQGDYTVMPVFAVYGNDHYMIDCVCSNALPEVTQELLADALYRNRVKACQFESNVAGAVIADNVEAILDRKYERDGLRSPCNITKKYTTANKETKIQANSTFIKRNCLFLDAKKVAQGSEYALFMVFMFQYTMIGKNRHDDVPDALAQYALFCTNRAENKAVIMKFPF